MATPLVSPCRLLLLPRELRDRIYEYVLIEDEPIVVHLGSPDSDSSFTGPKTSNESAAATPTARSRSSLLPDLDRSNASQSPSSGIALVRTNPGLLSTCRQIRIECGDMHFTQNRLLILAYLWNDDDLTVNTRIGKTLSQQVGAARQARWVHKPWKSVEISLGRLSDWSYGLLMSGWHIGSEAIVGLREFIPNLRLRLEVKFFEINKVAQLSFGTQTKEQITNMLDGGVWLDDGTNVKPEQLAAAETGWLSAVAEELNRLLFDSARTREGWITSWRGRRTTARMSLGGSHVWLWADRK